MRRQADPRFSGCSCLTLVTLRGRNMPLLDPLTWTSQEGSYQVIISNGVILPDKEGLLNVLQPQPYIHARSKWYDGKALEVQSGELYSQYNSLWVMSFVNLSFILWAGFNVHEMEMGLTDLWRE